MRPRKSVALIQSCSFVVLHTGEYLQALEMLVGMHIARRKGKVDPNQQEEQIRSSPHDFNQKPPVAVLFFRICFVRFEQTMLIMRSPLISDVEHVAFERQRGGGGFVDF